MGYGIKSATTGAKKAIHPSYVYNVWLTDDNYKDFLVGLTCAHGMDESDVLKHFRQKHPEFLSVKEISAPNAEGNRRVTFFSKEESFNYTTLLMQAYSIGSATDQGKPKASHSSLLAYNVWLTESDFLQLKSSLEKSAIKRGAVAFGAGESVLMDSSLLSLAGGPSCSDRVGSSCGGGAVAAAGKSALTVDAVKATYESHSRFGFFASAGIFGMGQFSKSLAEVEQSLRQRAEANPEGASAKTLAAHFSP